MTNLTEKGYFDITFSEDHKLCEIFAEGPIDFRQSLQAMNNAVLNPDFMQDTVILADIRLVDYHPSNDELKILSNHLKSFRRELRESKIALVCHRKLYSLGYLVSVLAGLARINMKTFMTMEEAKNWLDIDV